MPSLKDKQPSWYAFIIQYQEEKANGVNIEEFYSALHKIELKEVDQPNSTSPIYDLALFKNTNKIISRFSYEKTVKSEEIYPNADSFYKNAIKLPVWAFKDEGDIVSMYIKGISLVCELILNNPKELKERENNEK